MLVFFVILRNEVTKNLRSFTLRAQDDIPFAYARDDIFFDSVTVLLEIREKNKYFISKNSKVML